MMQNCWENDIEKEILSLIYHQSNSSTFFPATARLIQVQLHATMTHQTSRLEECVWKCCADATLVHNPQQRALHYPIFRAKSNSLQATWNVQMQYRKAGNVVPHCVVLTEEHCR